MRKPEEVDRSTLGNYASSILLVLGYCGCTHNQGAGAGGINGQNDDHSERYYISQDGDSIREVYIASLCFAKRSHIRSGKPIFSQLNYCDTVRSYQIGDSTEYFFGVQNDSYTSNWNGALDLLDTGEGSVLNFKIEDESLNVKGISLNITVVRHLSSGDTVTVYSELVDQYSPYLSVPKHNESVDTLVVHARYADNALDLVTPRFSRRYVLVL